MANKLIAISGTSPLRTLISDSPIQMKTLLFLSILIVLLLVTSSVEAATWYVRRGATGANTGVDWTNAYTQLPSPLKRGDTYYLADGTGYSGSGFTTATSGATYIYVKKCPSSAIKADACQNVSGWSDSYGDGQAIFNPTTINAYGSNYPGYIEVDGQFAYGIKFAFSDAQNVHGVWFNMGSPSNGAKGFQFHYVEFAGPGGPTGYPFVYSGSGIYEGGSPGDISGLTISHCSFHGMQTPIQLNGPGVHDVLMEYNDFYDVIAISPSTQHTNILWLGPSYNVTFRYNKSHNYSTEGVFLTAYQGGTPNNYYNIYIYGNVFYDGFGVGAGRHPKGVQIRDISDIPTASGYGAIYIYNNTCANLSSCVSVGTSATTGGAIRNNISYQSGGIGTWSIPSGNNLTVTDSSTFVNYASRDFRLASATSAGYALSSPINMDMNGIMRGTDGVWDLGAYEYNILGGGGGNIAKPSSPMYLRVN